MRGHYRHTKIIATVGPATETPEKLAQLITSGVDIIRLNMAHGSGEWVTNLVKRVRDVSADTQRHVAVMMDVKGPEIRTGPVADAIELKVGDTFEFFTQTPSEGVAGVVVNYPGLPGVDVNLPSLTEKDIKDVTVGVAAGIDFVALSFVRKADDIAVLRKLLDSLGSKARIIAKIEDQSGLKNLVEIVKATDAVMVARGDLGIEIDYFTLPLVQTRIVDVCLTEGKPVIIATHLLESMISAPMPTRAEISDICNAVRERADAVMLSGETTTGMYPLECVEVMKNILKTTEPTDKRGINEVIQLHEPKAKMLRSAAVLAQELGQSGIVVFTRSGFLAYTLAALRAVGVPIYAFTDDEALSAKIRRRRFKTRCRISNVANGAAKEHGWW
jgi:pyruvate kinase